MNVSKHLATLLLRLTTNRHRRHTNRRHRRRRRRTRLSKEPLSKRSCGSAAAQLRAGPESSFDHRWVLKDGIVQILQISIISRLTWRPYLVSPLLCPPMWDLHMYIHL